ncbi:MAG: hypothetical protein Q9166_007190 [cf. Caloplaca sp. 2 TL-2023]
MYTLAQAKWEEVIHQSRSEIVRGIQISYYELPRRPIDMQTKHVVFAMLLGLDTMDKMNDFSTGLIELRQNRKKFGFVRIGRRSEASKIESMNVTGVAETTKRDGLTAQEPRSQNGTNLIFPRGIIDPDDHDNMIEYERYGDSVPCKEIFGAALNALVKLAPYERDETIGMFTGENWSHKMVYQTFSKTRASGSLMLSHDLIMRVMRLLPKRLFEENSCGEVRFAMIYTGEKKGAGSFWVPDFAKGKQK